ncbi:hypothetical protein [Methylobacterium sp. CCH5-D2]|uniref:hypothetical protein n=1 Tax=Methylobacterium sp. CCH5-D2 TaxID=1768765 RepID=UPI000A58B5FC|nr:hypothetical protein [Methylobacterium sp. CCH5-D2]
MMRHRLPRETQIQAAVVEHWRTLGLPNTLVAAIPNAGAMGQAGLTRGVPDLLVLGGNQRFGLIELKTATGRPSVEQLDVQALCRAIGVSCEITYGRDDPIALLEQWGVIRPQVGGAA